MLKLKRMLIKDVKMIFLDAGYLIGLIISTDSNHFKSKQLSQEISHERKVINNVVLIEVLNSLNNYKLKLNADEVLDCLLKLDQIDVLNKDDYISSFNIFKYYNKSINYSDCTILKTMFVNNINKIVSFDSDFDKISGINRISL